MNKVIAYVRVSDRNRDDEKNSLPKQIEQIKAWCRYKGIDESQLEIVEDSKVSGSKASRKGFKLLVEKLKSKSYSILIVRDLSRLVRSVSIGSTFFESVIYKYDIKFVSLEDNIDTSTAMGKFVLNITLAKDQLYRDLISDKMNATYNRRRAANKRLSYKAPYGFKEENGVLVPNLEEQAIIERIRGLRDDGKTLKEIRKDLNYSGVISPLGGVWPVSSIRNLLNRK